MTRKSKGCEAVACRTLKRGICHFKGPPLLLSGHQRAGQYLVCQCSLCLGNVLQKVRGLLESVLKR